MKTLAALLLTAFLSSLPVAGYELRPGVVVDTASDVAFIACPDGAVEAISLGYGDSIWRNPAAQMPLAVVNGRLVAQVEVDAPGRLALAILDARSGLLLRSTEVKLPDSVHALVDDGLGTRFRVRAESTGGVPLFVWRHTYQEIRGTPPEEGEGGVTVQEGTFRLNLDSGEAWVAGAPLAAPRAAIEIAAPERLAGAFGRQFRAADGGFVLASDYRKSVVAGDSYTWTVLTSDGTVVGSMPAPVSYAPFHVTGRVLAFVLRPSIVRVGDDIRENPLSLRALSLVGGTEQWSVEIRDTTYSGPVPV